MSQKFRIHSERDAILTSGFITCRTNLTNRSSREQSPLPPLCWSTTPLTRWSTKRRIAVSGSRPTSLKDGIKADPSSRKIEHVIKKAALPRTLNSFYGKFQTGNLTSNLNFVHNGIVVFAIPSGTHPHRHHSHSNNNDHRRGRIITTTSPTAVNTVPAPTTSKQRHHQRHRQPYYSHHNHQNPNHQKHSHPHHHQPPQPC